MPTTVSPRSPSLPEKEKLRTDPHLYECFKKIEEWMRQMSVWAANLQITSVNEVPAASTAPTVISIDPASGTATGGDSVTITGTGFTLGATATVGGVPLTSLTVVSPTSITGTTGAHAAGAVDVVVTNFDTQTGTLTNGFTYVLAPPVPYVLTQTVGTPRNNYDGYLGFKFNTGANAPIVTALGRWKISGNSLTHNLYLYKFVDGVGGDVQIATATVDLSGGSDGEYLYANLGSPVTLLAATDYYVISQEANGFDQWYDNDTTLDTFTSGVGTESASVFTPTLASVLDNADPGFSYIPVNFKVQQ